MYNRLTTHTTSSFLKSHQQQKQKFLLLSLSPKSIHTYLIHIRISYIYTHHNVYITPPEQRRQMSLKDVQSIDDPYVPEISSSLRKHLSPHYDTSTLNEILETLATPVRRDSHSFTTYIEN